jgi:predicted glycogen debranching enzyme
VPVGIGANPASPTEPAVSGYVRHLALAADQFIVRRPSPDDPEGRSVIAGYPWFGDWGRDTMISLPGLTLATGRAEVARSILRTFARFVDQGMLPNRFPDAGETPEYNTVDATLWYFEALRAYHTAAGDEVLLRDLWPTLQEIIAWHQRGTRYHIRVDPADGLLYAGEPGVQLTWMDAKVGDWVVTPRMGKPVEVNALWYNALRIMADFACRLDQPADDYQAGAEKTLAGFARFWNETAGYCFDVLDGPDGHEATLRPNQILAVSLPYSPLTTRQQQAVVDVCARHLLTPHGLRSLAPGDPAYVGHYGGGPRQRDAAYHQGTVWAWLMGPFISAHLRVYQNPALARSYLLPLLRSLASNCVGSISEIFEGDPPFLGRGCIAQAWSVAEVLRAWQEISQAEN